MKIWWKRDFQTGFDILFVFQQNRLFSMRSTMFVDGCSHTVFCSFCTISVCHLLRLNAIERTWIRHNVHSYSFSAWKQILHRCKMFMENTIYMTVNIYDIWNVLTLASSCYGVFLIVRSFALRKPHSFSFQVFFLLLRDNFPWEILLNHLACLNLCCLVGYFLLAVWAVGFDTISFNTFHG